MIDLFMMWLLQYMCAFMFQIPELMTGYYKDKSKLRMVIETIFPTIYLIRVKTI